jgi:hypothetical protein
MKLSVTFASFLSLLFLSPAAAQTLVGVPVCDDFLKKYEQCLDKLSADPAAVGVKASLQQTVQQMRTSYKTMADNPQTRPAVEQVCKQSLEQVKVQMSAAPYHCSF